MKLTNSCILALVAVSLAIPSASTAKRDKSVPLAPKGNQASWFPPDSYPVEAKRRGEQGRVSVKVAVDEFGVPTGCTVVESSGSATLDEATCSLVKANAKFNPARDARGKAISASFTVRGVRWALSVAGGMDLPTLPVTQIVRNIEIEVDEQGKGLSCRPLPSAAVGDTGCGTFVPGKQVIAPATKGGKPTKAKVTATTTIRIEPE